MLQCDNEENIVALTHFSIIALETFIHSKFTHSKLLIVTDCVGRNTTESKCADLQCFVNSTRRTFKKCQARPAYFYFSIRYK